VVTITGTGFGLYSMGATVTFGGAAATSVVMPGPNQISATTPAHAAGAVAVVVTNILGSGSCAACFTYTAPPSPDAPDGSGPVYTPPPAEAPDGSRPVYTPPPAEAPDGSRPVYTPPPAEAPDGSRPVYTPPSSAKRVETQLPVQLPSSGVITAPLTTSNGQAKLDLQVLTVVRRTDGTLFTGQFPPPAVRPDPTGGKVVSVFEFGAPGASLVFDRPVTLTIPAPAGVDAHELQPVAIDASGGLTYLPGHVDGGTMSFETTHLSLYGLAKVTRPDLVGMRPTFTKKDGYHARWAGQSRYVELAAGQLADLAVRFVNSGSVGWTVGRPGQQAVLGSSDPLDNTRDAGILVASLYDQNRYATTSEASVAPGDLGTFSFRVRAPAAPGTYQIHVRLVIEGIAWLEDEGVYVQIMVR
jgi:hypothetical protein